MTYSIKLVGREPATCASQRKELMRVLARIKDEGIPADLIEGSDGLEIKAQTKAIAERIVDNRQINRKGRAEIYLTQDPPGSNCPTVLF